MPCNDDLDLVCFGLRCPNSGMEAMSWATGGLGYNPQLPATRQATRMTFLRDKETPSPRDPAAHRHNLPVAALASASPPSREVKAGQPAAPDLSPGTPAPHGQDGDAHSAVPYEPPSLAEERTAELSRSGVGEAPADAGERTAAQSGAGVQSSSFKDELLKHPIAPAPTGLTITDIEASRCC